MDRKLNLAGNAELLKRRESLEKLVAVLCEPCDEPWLLTDLATVFEVSMESPKRIAEKIEIAYGKARGERELHLPLWRLIDLLDVRPAL